MSNTSTKIEGTKPYDMFVIGVSILSIINILLLYIFSDPTIEYVIGTMDVVLSIFFFVDFLRNMRHATSKSQYFFKDFGWADLLASMPFPQFKILRIFRLIKAYRLLKKDGGRSAIRNFVKNKAEGAVYIVFFMIILLLEFGSIAVLKAEMSNPEANIKTASDAIWWVYVTITTVGYGDRYPVTNAGRLVGMVVMFVGVGLFAVMTGFLANKFLPSTNEENPDMVNKDRAISELRKEIAELKTILKDKK